MIARLCRTNILSNSRSSISRNTGRSIHQSFNSSITRTSLVVWTAWAVSAFHTVTCTASPLYQANDPLNNQASLNQEKQSTMAASYGSLIDTAAVIQPTGEHKYTLIFIHGLGDSSDGFKDMFENPPFSQTILKNTRIVLPNAPTQPVSVNNGYRMQSWYDIYTLGSARMTTDPREDDVGLNKAKESIHQLIRQEAAINQIGTKNIILGGFSQGAACSIYSGLTFPDSQIGAILALSGYLMLSKAYPDVMSQYAKSIPVLAYHGKSDPTVPFELAKLSWSKLKEHGVTLKFLAETGLGHSLSNDEIKAMLTFLNEKIYQRDAQPSL